MTPRFVVGIDLGTTHTAVAYAPTDGGAVESFSVPQLVARGQLEARALLPSFIYFAHENEGAEALPWDDRRTFSVGEHARSRAADAPSRVISSAKSWLSHAGIDRRAGVLPLDAPEDVEKISPVEASFHLLEHVAEAWDFAIAKGDSASSLANQEVILTVPASFDAAARELTVEAALAAGLDHVTLLEEPQAALYAWTAARGDAWRKELHAGDVVLVIDVGGGTTDFSAIVAQEKDGALELSRVAVGDHILLGGDNIDLALAHLARTKLEDGGHEVDRAQMTALGYACRIEKERLLTDSSLSVAPIAVAARGAKLVGGGLRTEITREELDRTIDGFFPRIPASAKPGARARGALTELGLPYASDPAVTKHLAAFLTRQVAVAKEHGLGADENAKLLHPTAVLFNGGVMKSEAVRARIIDTLNAWLAEDGAPPARVLGGGDLDLGVARGAAAYGLVRRGHGIRIRGGTARAYYVGIESNAPAVPGVEPDVTAICVAPFGMEEGAAAKIERNQLGLVVGEAVHFRFFGSSVRRDDKAGDLIERWKNKGIEELAPIEITLPADGRDEGSVVAVHLESAVTEIGTLVIEAVPTRPLRDDERWKIELNVRETST
ncbi:MAG: Hsp70 family protein [Polyangiaceae bacterium]